MSSTKPLQSSSAPLHTSNAGVRAVQLTHPWAESQVSVPEQMPAALVTWHRRTMPALAVVHSQVPDIGMHCRMLAPKSWHL